MTLYLQHFGLTQPPLGKAPQELWDDGTLARVQERFRWRLDAPGLGLLTGEPGVGKTALLPLSAFCPLEFLLLFPCSPCIPWLAETAGSISEPFTRAAFLRRARISGGWRFLE